MNSINKTFMNWSTASEALTSGGKGASQIVRCRFTSFPQTKQVSTETLVAAGGPIGSPYRHKIANASSASLSALVAFACLSVFCIAGSGCSRPDESANAAKTPVSQDSQQATLRHPLISQQGERIEFASADSSRNVLGYGVAGYRDISITTSAPARIILTTVKSEGATPSLSVPVFESSDLTQLYTDYIRARHDLSRASREAERLRDLYAHSAVAGKDVTQAESDQIMAQTTLTGLESRLLTAGLSAKELENLRADVSILIANVPESEIASVQMGEDVQIEFESFKGEILHGRVQDIGHAVDATTRTFNVRIVLSDTKHMLRPGMFAKASFGVDVMRRFVVPQSAVVSVQGKSYVFVTRDHRTYERREVMLGQQSLNYFILLGGLSDGEEVVTDGAVLLKGLSFGS